HPPRPRAGDGAEDAQARRPTAAPRAQLAAPLRRARRLAGARRHRGRLLGAAPEAARARRRLCERAPSAQEPPCAVHERTGRRRPALRRAARHARDGAVLVRGLAAGGRHVRAVVTGGAGFIGSHLVDALLARGDEVTIIDNFATGKRENLRAEATLAERDVREDLGDVFDEARPDVCFHLAAQADVRVSVADPEFDAQVNTIGTVRVLEGARRNGTHVVFSSTGGAIYGESPEPATEESPRQPLPPPPPSPPATPAAEDYIRPSNRLYESGHIALRYGNVYGPRQDPHGEAGVVAIFFSRLREGEGPRIFGDGLQTRDYVFVGDV